MELSAKVIRVITIAPIMALLLMTSLYLSDAALLGGLPQYLASIFFLAVLPVLAYPLQSFIPLFKRDKRSGQRKLAFITSVVGYLCGIIFATATNAPMIVHVIYWTYFLSVTLLTAFNSFTPWKASGHACGVCGPVVTMVYFIGPQALTALLIYVALFWASLKMKRHTVTELILGGLDSVFAFAIVLLMTREML